MKNEQQKIKELVEKFMLNKKLTNSDIYNIRAQYNLLIAYMYMAEEYNERSKIIDNINTTTDTMLNMYSNNNIHN